MSDPFGPFQAARQRILDWQAVATALVQAAGLHEGIWRVYFKFGLHGANVTIDGTLSPVAMVQVIEMGLARDTELSELSVDAAVVNPEPLVRLN